MPGTVEFHSDTYYNIGFWNKIWGTPDFDRLYTEHCCRKLLLFPDRRNFYQAGRRYKKEVKK
jgi:hypothetical protein